MRDILIEFLDSLREYLDESSEDLKTDDRDSSEFVDIFLNKEKEIMEEIECNECGWVGDTSELVSLTWHLDDPCDKCPECNSDNIEDFE